MKIEKHIAHSKDWICYYYVDSKTNNKTPHGLFNSIYCFGLVYQYHLIKKGFSLVKF